MTVPLTLQMAAETASTSSGLYWSGCIATFKAAVTYDLASANSQFSIFYTVVFPVGGAAAFVLAVFVLWGWYSRRYEKKAAKN